MIQLGLSIGVGWHVSWKEVSRLQRAVLTSPVLSVPAAACGSAGAVSLNSREPRCSHPDEAELFHLVQKARC